MKVLEILANSSNKGLKNDSKQKVSLIKVMHLILYFSTKKNLEGFGQFLTKKIDIKTPKFANFKP